jgi:hypothetical protein
MFHHVFYAVLSIVFNLAFVILPSAPLFALEKHPPFAVKNSRSAYHPGSNNGHLAKKPAASMAEKLKH